MPDVGHAEAFNYPDQSHLSWRYKQDFSGKKQTKNNTAIFLDAAKTIFSILCKFNDKPCNWQEFAGKIEEALATPTDSQLTTSLKYSELFCEIGLSYDEEQWRREALRGERFEWIYFEQRDYKSQSFEYNGDLKWFYFHKAAYEQRISVLKRIRLDLV